MTLTNHDLDDIKERAAQLLVDKIQSSVGDYDTYKVLPLAFASTLLSLSTQQIKVYLPIVSIANGKHGVTLAAIKEHIASRTKPPIKKPKTERGAE